MPLPALHERFARAIAKTVMAPDLSLRGRFAPVAISGRHCRLVPATVKTVCTDCVCSGGQRPPLAVTGFCAPSPTVQCPQICHCEAPTGPWQSRRTRPNREKAIGENATASPRLHPKGTSSRFALRAPRRPAASSQ